MPAAPHRETLRALLPTTDDPIPPAIVGAALTLTVPTGLPALFLAGYLVRVVRAGADGEPLPRFDDWRGLATDGLAVAAIGAAVLVVPAVCLAALVGAWTLVHALGVGPAPPGLFAALGSLVPFGSAPGPASGVGATAGIGARAGPAGAAIGPRIGVSEPAGLPYALFGLLTTVLTLLAGYLATVATAVYARRESVLAALSPARLAGRALHVRTAGLVVGCGLVASVARAIGFLLGIVPVVGGFLGAAAAFAGSVVAAHLLGRLWRGGGGPGTGATARGRATTTTRGRSSRSAESRP